MQLKSVSVTGLFGVFDHHFDLHIEDRVTIVHGPNGFGKTVMLNMIAGLLRGDLTVFEHIPFRSFRIGLTDGTAHSLTRDDDGAVDTEPSITFVTTDASGRVIPTEQPAVQPIPRAMLRDIDRVVPSPLRLEKNYWVDDEGRRYSLSRVLEMFPQVAATVPPAFRPKDAAPISDIAVLFVETNRLRVEQVEDEQPDFYTYRHVVARQGRGIQYKVERNSQDLTERISSALADYAKHSQDRDRTFPDRLVRFLREGRLPLEAAALLEQMTALENKRQRLVSLGILDSEVGLSEMSEDDVKRAREALTLYVGDVSQKLTVLDDLLRRIGTFRDILNARLEGKLRNPNVGRVASAVLKDGPRAYRIATLYQIINPSTNEHHHWCLKINSFDRTKKTGWSFKPTHSVLMDDDGSQELSHLAGLIRAAEEGRLNEGTGDYHLVPSTQIDSIKTLLRFVGGADAAQRMRLVRTVLENLDLASVQPGEWVKVFEAGSEGVRRTIAVSARLAEYKGVRDKLAALIVRPEVPEGQLQTLLHDNPWLFGSEYSELLARRTWTRDDRLDFMLRRTADGYLEIVEIKTPLRQPLFRYDQSHDSFATSAPLADVLGQVVRYIDEIERQRDSMVAKDGFDPLKIRARVIIGRDGDPSQQAALRRLNGHLHRIEVLTFDQLLRIADRVLSVFEVTLARTAL